MMSSTMFDPITLEDWYSDDDNDFLLQKELDNYLQNYFPCFSLQPKENCSRPLFRAVESFRVQIY